TAEMPDMYGADDYDLAGFTVGAVEKKKLITEGAVKAGDTLIGIPSSGIHSNGYSLVRKIFFKDNDFKLNEAFTELDVPLVEELLKPTRIYVKPVLEVLKAVDVHGITHVTGGGFVENLPRMLTNDLAVKVELGSWPVLPIFDLMKKYGQLSELEMYEIFNMGIGMVLAVAKEDVEKTLEVLVQNGEAAYVIGEVTTRSDDAVIFGGAKG
ncbi:phosphoribosylformylglycinamidine cyclo-ligase, partial [Listeria innocua]|nr:phosphoribosylformylglycinamidine cyclo-ligase [Listeria innocua]